MNSKEAASADSQKGKESQSKLKGMICYDRMSCIRQDVRCGVQQSAANNP